MSLPSSMSLSPFSKTHVSKRSTSAGRSAGSTASSTFDVRTRFATMRRRQCAASSMPTSGRFSATASSASRRATSKIDGRHATTLAARGARDKRAISPKSAPLASRASVTTLPSSVVRRTSSSPRATMYASAPSSPSEMTALPAGTVNISKQPMRARRPSFSSALKSGSGDTSGGSESASASYSSEASWMMPVAFDSSAGPVRNELSGWKLAS